MQEWDEKSNSRFILFLVWAKAYSLESLIQKNALNIQINQKQMEQNDHDRKFNLINICSRRQDSGSPGSSRWTHETASRLVG